MLTEQQLIQEIKQLGIKENDVVTFHISLKSLGEIDTSEKTGAEVVIDAFRACLPDGLLIIPSHTFLNVRQTPVFDVRNTMPCIGALPRVAVEMANEAHDNGDLSVIRSLHPAHSVVAFGKKASEYVANDAYACSPMPENGSYRKLYSHNAKILMIGVGIEKNTFIHAIDEYMEPDGVSAPYSVTAIDYNGEKSERTVRNCHGPSREYGKYIPVLEEKNAIAYAKLGNADVIVCNAVKTFEAITSVWKNLNPR